MRTPDAGGAVPLSPPEVAETTSITVRPAALWSALFIVYVVWGSTYLAIRITVTTMPAFLSGGLRFTAAGVVVGLFLAFRRGVGTLRVPVRQVAGCGLVGTLLLAFGNGGVVLAESLPPGRGVASGVAALLIAAVPLIVVLLRALTGDRPRWTTVLGVVAGFAGLTTLVLSRGNAGAVAPLGAGIVLVAATCWASGSFFSQKLPMPSDPFTATVYEMIIGGAVLLATGLVRGEHLVVSRVSTSSWLALAYLTLAGSMLAFTSYVWLLQHAPISLTSTYAYVNPAVAVLLGALVLGEPLTAGILAGGAIVVAGVALVVSTERPRTAKPRAG